MDSNILLMADYYKHAHYLMYPPGTEYVYSYIESRGVPTQDVLFFGLQGFLKEYLIDCRRDVYEAGNILHGGFNQHYFNYEDWNYIVDELDGKLPIHIRALPEGSIVPRGTPLVTIENTDPKCWWLPQFLETMLLRATWYPSTVASVSMEAKNIIAKYCKLTGCDVSPFHLLDFGARGASSHETAAIGGAAHLLNFQGTDNIEGVKYLIDYYNAPVSGFSVMASEHSLTTAYGYNGELDAYKRFFKVCPPEATISIVIDTYDDIRAIRDLFGGELRQLILDKPGICVFRPDSGDVKLKPSEIADELLVLFGGSADDSGCKRLHPKIKILQGDGISNLTALNDVCAAIVKNKWCMSNFMFGMGGGLLQNCTRDTYGFAQKASHVIIDGVGKDICKAPKSDPFKASKSGRFNDPRLETVFLNGELVREQSLDDIKEVMNEYKN